MIFKTVKAYSFLLVCALLISSCASISPAEVKSVNFGEKPIAHETDIKKLMSKLLKDPDSAKYTFGEPRKGMVQDGFLRGGTKYYGYIVPTEINAKNSYGGYTGGKLYYFMLSGGLVWDASSSMASGNGTFAE